MAVDEALAERVRKALGERPGVSEKRMFGGICFLVNGNMLCCAGRDRMLFRVGKAQTAAALKRPGARPLEMRGKPLPGFVFVGAERCDLRGLRAWIAFADEHVAKLPPKAAKKIRPTR